MYLCDVIATEKKMQLNEVDLGIDRGWIPTALCLRERSGKL